MRQDLIPNPAVRFIYPMVVKGVPNHTFHSRGRGFRLHGLS